MREFKQKTMVNQSVISYAPMKPNQEYSLQSHDRKSILHLQQTSGNQAVERILHASKNTSQSKSGCGFRSLAQNRTSSKKHRLQAVDLRSTKEPCDCEEQSDYLGPRTLAVTQNGVTTFSSDVNGNPKEAEIRAHEAVHRAQFAVHGSRPEGLRRELEREAKQGAAILLDGRSYNPSYSAAPGLTLKFEDQSNQVSGTSTRDQDLEIAIRQQIGLCSMFRSIYNKKNDLIDSDYAGFDVSGFIIKRSWPINKLSPYKLGEASILNALRGEQKGFWAGENPIINNSDSVAAIVVAIAPVHWRLAEQEVERRRPQFEKAWKLWRIPIVMVSQTGKLYRFEDSS